MRLLIISIFSAFSILPAFVLCQNRGLLWQETIGGTGEDRLNKLIHDSENNYYVIGTIQSEGENTNDDVLLSKFNSNGQEVWRKIIGGEKDDQGIDLILTSNNQLLVLIYSNSKTGDFSSNKGYSDIFLAQFSLDGNRQWMKNFGGSFIDIPTSIIERSSGEILISAHTRSTNGNVSTSLGQFDLWLLNVNQEGSLIWEKSYGGSEEDFSTQVIELQTGEIMLLGKSSSYNHDIQLNYGDFDVILLKIGPTGKLIWSKNFGGERADYSANILEVENQSVLVVGNTFSETIDIDTNAGNSDAWLFKVDKLGNLVWSTTMGNTANEISRSISMNKDGEIIIAGTTNSFSLNNSTNKGKTDVWIASIEQNKFESLFLYGSSGFESINNVLLQNNGEIIISGSTDYGLENSDGWLVKLANSSKLDKNAKVSIHPNPSNGVFYVNYLSPSSSLCVYSADGKKVNDAISSSGTMFVLNLTNFPSGMYFLKVIDNDKHEETYRLTKE